MGTLKYKNGEYFEGSFTEGFKSIGKHTLVDSSFYEGMFQDNLPHGTG
jgi:hypothetical protein